MSTATSATPPEARRMSSAARLIGVFFSPSATFADIAREPHFILCLCVQAFVGALAPFYLMRRLTLPVMVQQIMHNNPRMANMDPAQAQQVAETIEKTTRWSFYFTPLIVVGMIALLAVIFLFGMNFLLGQETDYKHCLAVTAHGMLPGTVLALLGMVVLAVVRDPSQLRFDNLVASNPGFFLSADASAVLRAFFTRLDLFSLWTILLLAIGFSRVGRKLKTSSAFWMVFGFWLLWVLVLTGLAAL